jgi:HK97 family phage major capsid protein
MERTLVTTTTATLWEPVQTPAAPVPVTRRLFVRDLLAQTQVSGNSLTIMQESNTATNELLANVVAEGAAKPEVALSWTTVTVPIRKIAAWIPLTTEIIEDAPALRGYIDNRLLYMLKLREEIEFLSGDGTGAHILGIRNQSGLQTQAALYEGGATAAGTRGDVPATIGSAIGKVENVDGEADGVAMNPLDFWAAVVQRHAISFDNGFGGNAPASASSITWGLPVIRTRGMETGKALVGAWRQGATVLDRSAAQIEIGNQHSTYFVENKVAVRAEERVGLAVDHPNYFVETDITLVHA